MTLGVDLLVPGWRVLTEFAVRRGDHQPAGLDVQTLISGVAQDLHTVYAVEETDPAGLSALVMSATEPDRVAPQNNIRPTVSVRIVILTTFGQALQLPPVLDTTAKLGQQRPGLVIARMIVEGVDTEPRREHVVGDTVAQVHQSDKQVVHEPHLYFATAQGARRRGRAASRASCRVCHSGPTSPLD